MSAIQKVPAGLPSAEALEPRRLMAGPPSYGVTMVGRVFEDLDADGKWDRGEPPVAGVGFERVGPLGGVTAEDGRFEIFNLGNIVDCQVVPPPGMHVTPPDGGYREAERSGHRRGSHVLKRVRPIPLTRAAGIAGHVFLDRNGNGTLDAYDDDGLRGRSVLLDLDGDGRRDRGERLFRTGRGGLFGFGGLEPGTYRLYLLPRRARDADGAEELHVTVAPGQLAEAQFALAPGRVR